MLTKDKILELAKQKKQLVTRDLVKRFSVSRQYASGLLSELVSENVLVKIGSTRKSFYILPQYAQKHKELFPASYRKAFKNVALEEHKVLAQIEKEYSPLNDLSENVMSIFTYAFSEMFNNAIEHSKSTGITVEVSIQNKVLTFTVNDSGIGVFKNIMQKRHLKSELESIQELMKGKTTTMPKSHSGEGIFFTSKVGDQFLLDSYGYQFAVDNKLPDVFVKKVKKIKRGTTVVFKIGIGSENHLNELFREYTAPTKGGDHGFDKTKIQIKLYTLGGVHISRSQARRVLAGLEKFKYIVFDFDKVPVVGQAFADEIFRVFHSKYPNIKLEAINMDEDVEFMVKRAKSAGR